MGETDQRNRIEKDYLGERSLPANALYGIHSLRAVENFPLSGQPVHPELIRAYGSVKLAAAITNQSLGIGDSGKKDAAIRRACEEMSEGLLNRHVIVDALQGGAGTSTNMNVNEVIANRALEILGEDPGSYHIVSPTEDINLHQSTNDTYPTALKLAAMRLITELESKIVPLQEAFQHKEKEFAHIVKVGRTQYRDAVLTTLGREMSAYADVLSRDRWRIYKIQERLRVIGAGGTAIGSGLGAPRDFIFRFTDNLRSLTGFGLSRAENLTDNIQNADVFVETSGILKAYASTLIKIANDIRLLSSGPHAGLAELKLPMMQAGSSIMPGKENPVIPEAVVQSAILFMSYDQAIAQAASLGSLELNAFLPLIAHVFLSGISLLSGATEIFTHRCVRIMEANEENCRHSLENSTATATALVERLGYEKVNEIVKWSRERGTTIRHAAGELAGLGDDEFDELISPEATTRLGSPDIVRNQTMR